MISAGAELFTEMPNGVMNPRPEDVALIGPIEGVLKPPFKKGGRFVLKSTTLMFMLFTAKPIDYDPVQRRGFSRMK